ncbi:MAG: hypothetical protein ABUK01_18985 [Leptospirales bacterium]
MHSRDETLNILNPYLPKINLCIKNGISRFNKEYTESGKAVSLSKTTLSSALRDYIVEEVEKEFNDMQGHGIYIRRKGLLFYIEINNNILIKFKKLDRYARPSNIQTQQVLEFCNEGQGELFGERTYLAAGYKKKDQEYEYSFVVCPKGRNKLAYWVHEFGDKEARDIVIELPIDDNTQVPQLPLTINKKFINKNKDSEIES